MSTEAKLNKIAKLAYGNEVTDQLPKKKASKKVDFNSAKGEGLTTTIYDLRKPNKDKDAE